jgi:hypothetical protein
MTGLNHDTFKRLHQGTPPVFLVAAWSIPVFIAVQFLLAGQALFGGLSWNLHGTVGALASVPVFVVAGYATFVPWLRGFGWWALIIIVLYFTQIGLAAGGTTALALHPFNAALLLTASLIFLFKVERRRGLRASRKP